MILTLKLELDMVKMYHHTKNEVSMSRHSKVIAQRDRQTGRHIHTHMSCKSPLSFITCLLCLAHAQGINGVNSVEIMKTSSH